MKTVVLFSGGLDSTVLMHTLAGELYPVFCDYGQPHLEAEYAAAERIWPSKLIVIELPQLTMPGRIGKASVVPGRNLLMVAAAAAYALSIGASRVVSGVNATDHDVYADCLPEFNTNLDRLLYSTYGVRYVAPFENTTKAEIVALGRECGAPIADSWSCYNGGDEPCGECSACHARAEALA